MEGDDMGLGQSLGGPPDEAFMAVPLSIPHRTGKSMPLLMDRAEKSASPDSCGQDGQNLK